MSSPTSSPSSSTSPPTPAPKSHCNASSWASSSNKSSSARRRRTGRTITFTAHEPATVEVRVSACDRAITNLVDNACKFSPADTAVDVAVAGTMIEVGDRGPGIAPEDRDHVFDRFYRATVVAFDAGFGTRTVDRAPDRRAPRRHRRAGGTRGRRHHRPLHPPVKQQLVVLRRVLLLSRVPVRRAPDGGW